VGSALPVSEARGATLLCLADWGIPVFEYTPLVIKQTVVGVGRAEKTQVQEMVRLILGLADYPKPDHAATLWLRPFVSIRTAFSKPGSISGPLMPPKL
jgi:crossover junction endodeoxyribonuclease RuvC